MPVDNTVLLLTNQRHRAAGAGPENAHNRMLLAARGWSIELVYIPTDSIRSLLSGTIRAIRRARRQDVDVIDSHCSPPELHVVGLLVSRLSGTPWLAEFRDPLAPNVHVKSGSVSYYLRRVLERIVVRTANQVVWWNGIQLDDDYFERTYPKVPSAQWYKIPELGFGGLNTEKFNSIPSVDHEEFTIVYAGSFYDGWIEPDAFLEGLSAYHEAYREALSVRFYGDWRPKYDALADDLGIDQLIEPKPSIPHDELVGVLKGADVLLYVGGNNPQNRRNIPLKLCDYLGAKTPVLGIVNPDFRAASLIEGQGMGIVVSPTDTSGIADAISRFRSGAVTFDVDDSVFEWFSSERAMDRYAGVLSAVASGDRPTDVLSPSDAIDPI